MSRSRTKKKKTRRKSLLPSWLSHRSLILSETVLVVALAQMLARDWIFSQHQWPSALRVVLGMALIVGAFGWLIVYLHDRVKWSLQTTYDAVQQLPVPTPYLVVHLGVFAILFIAYAWYWGLPLPDLAAVDSVWSGSVGG
jgi:branched-subunit amino acid transport protein AzlD